MAGTREHRSGGGAPRAGARSAQSIHPQPRRRCLRLLWPRGRGASGIRQGLRDPNYLVGLYLGGGVYSRLGRHEEALGLFAKGAELSGRAAFYVSYYAWALARAGRIDEARAGLAELESRAKNEYVQHLHL